MRSGTRAVRSLAIAGIFLSGLALGTAGPRVLGVVALPFTETPLLRTDLPGIDGHELIVSRLETAPGWGHGRHYHAGHEIVYVLEGSGALEVEGKPEQRLAPGTASYVPPRQAHAGRNTGRSSAFKFLLIRIHVKGEPISVELQ